MKWYKLIIAIIVCFSIGCGRPQSPFVMTGFTTIPDNYTILGDYIEYTFRGTNGYYGKFVDTVRWNIGDTVIFRKY